MRFVVGVACIVAIVAVSLLLGLALGPDPRPPSGAIGPIEDPRHP